MTSLRQFPTELTDFYNQMMGRFKGDDLRLEVLATMSTVYRPITLKELMLLNKFRYAEHYMRRAVEACGSFLTIREDEDLVFFIHQSAKDFLLTHRSTELFPRGLEHQHETLFLRCLDSMKVLKRDIYDVRHPGLHVDEISSIERTCDSLVEIRYSCVYWMDHLLQLDFLMQRPYMLQTFARFGDSLWVSHDLFAFLVRSFEPYAPVISCSTHFAYCREAIGKFHTARGTKTFLTTAQIREN